MILIETPSQGNLLDMAGILDTIVIQCEIALLTLSTLTEYFWSARLTPNDTKDLDFYTLKYSWPGKALPLPLH